jgi:hypothetical protein
METPTRPPRKCYAPFMVRFDSAAERDLFNATAARIQKSANAWARAVLLAAADAINAELDKPAHCERASTPSRATALTQSDGGYQTNPSNAEGPPQTS